MQKKRREEAKNCKEYDSELQEGAKKWEREEKQNGFWHLQGQWKARI